MYFHEATKEEIELATQFHPNITCEDFAKIYPQPKWCTYPEAVSPLGCWSLIGFYVTGEKYCKSCDLYSPSQLKGGNYAGQT